MTGAFSVIEVVTAARCPRQLVLLREGHRVTPPGGEAIGQVAHGALTALARAAALDGALLRALSPATPDETAVTAACYALAYPHVYHRAVELAPSVDGEALGRLDAVLRHLSGLMAGLLLRARASTQGAAQALASVVVATERDVSLEIGGFRINGRIDLICRDAGTDETWLWDLETYAGTEAAQEQQVRLYALASERAGLRARPALLHVTGERVEIGPVQPSDPAATEALQAKLQDMSAWLSGTRPPPVTRDTALCRSCPAQEACWRRWGRTLDESAAHETSRTPATPAPASVTAAPAEREGSAPPPPPSGRERNRPPATPPPLPPDARGSGRWPAVSAPDAGGVPTVAADARGSGRWAALRPTNPAGVPTVAADARGSGLWPVAVAPDPDATPALALPVPPLAEVPPDGGDPVVVAVSVRESGRWMMARATPAQQPAVMLPAAGAASGARVVSISPLPPTHPDLAGHHGTRRGAGGSAAGASSRGVEGPSQGPSYYRLRTPARLDPGRPAQTRGGVRRLRRGQDPFRPDLRRRSGAGRHPRPGVRRAGGPGPAGPPPAAHPARPGRPARPLRRHRRGAALHARLGRWPARLAGPAARARTRLQRERARLLLSGGGREPAGQHRAAGRLAQAAPAVTSPSTWRRSTPQGRGSPSRSSSIACPTQAGWPTNRCWARGASARPLSSSCAC